VTAGHFRRHGIFVAACALAMAAIATAQSHAQAPASSLATLQGYVRDSAGAPVANATVFLQCATGTEAAATSTELTNTDSEGAYRFAAISPGTCLLRAEKTEYGVAAVGPVGLTAKETKRIDLALGSAKASESRSALGAIPATTSPLQAPEFFDEPQFTVAGVTQATNSGGHGSDTVLRTTEALARATASLSKESVESSAPGRSSASETSLRETLARDPDNQDANRQLGQLLVDKGKAADGIPYLERASRLNPGDPALHHLLGEIDEKLGNPLGAVREYERAAELDPSEVDLFDWGTELMTHRALEPATEVFTKGNRLFPKSVRMLIALGVAWYARGAYDQAERYLVNASDLAPDDPTPYIFLGKMQSVETTPREGSAERFARFAQLHPDNALANYYYAASLSKQAEQQLAGAADGDRERSARVEALLQKAVQIDPKLGEAYLQLGILYSRLGDFSRAISAYQRAIEVSPENGSPQRDETLVEAHYRLAQAYVRTGNQAKAKEELELHAKLDNKTKEDTERERHEIQEFMIALRNKDSGSH
jgi:tetratricopeptide (TPR) repeat protein